MFFVKCTMMLLAKTVEYETKSTYSAIVSQVSVNNGCGPAAVNRDETANRHPQRRAHSYKKTNSTINIVISCVRNNNLDKLETNVKRLIEQGGGINGKENDNPFGWSPLHYSSFIGNRMILRYLLTVENIDVNITDGNGVTPLMCAAIENRKVRIFFYILNFKANGKILLYTYSMFFVILFFSFTMRTFNLVHVIHHTIPLHFILFFFFFVLSLPVLQDCVVELLSDNRVDLGISSKDNHLGGGKTAAQLACFYKYPDIAEIIENHSRERS